MNRRAGRRRLPVFRLLLMAVSVGSLVWASGLYRFSQLIPQPLPDNQVATDAIVVPTGGAGRVGEGLSLLERGLAKKLFVSGVYRGVDVQELLKVARRAPGNLECCIALGYAEDNTRGNARETADWMRRENISAIRIVTASYHMPRSLLEFRRALPADVRIVPHPVFPDGFPTGSWWRNVSAMRLAISEYHKYLLARLDEGLT